MESLGDVMKIIELEKGTIEEKYDLPGLDLIAIERNSSDRLDCVANGYYIGRYLQRMELRSKVR